MSLPSSGQITLTDINNEWGWGATNSTVPYQESEYYGVDPAIPAAGTIAHSDFHGTDASWYGTITTNQQNLDLATWALANGWSAGRPAIITVNAGVYIWSSALATPGMIISSAFTNSVTVINNGFIMGMGGRGGHANAGTSVAAAQAGRFAIRLDVDATINTGTGYIGGGGGGGGAQTTGGDDGSRGGGGGGAGGGAGGRSTNNAGATGIGGAGGGAGASGANGTAPIGGAPGRGGQAGGEGGNFVAAGKATDSHSAGGGGGRIMPGTVANGASNGGVGRGGNSPGGVGARGGGGGYGASGGAGSSGAGGAGGPAIDQNGFTATIVGGLGLVYGAII